MCIAIAGLGSAVPTRAELTISCVNNPDGFGYAIVTENSKRHRELIIDCTMEGTDAVDDFLEVMCALGDSVVAWTFHARIQTHGEVCLENCHPFFLGDDALTVVCHNGILPVTIDKKDHRSDTRVFAEDYLTALGGVAGLSDPIISNIVEGFVYGCNSKVVVLSANPEADYPLTIFGESLGHWRDKKIWFANRSYEETPAYSHSTLRNRAGRINPTTKRWEYEDEWGTPGTGDFTKDLEAVRDRALQNQLLNLADTEASEDDEKMVRCTNPTCGGFVSEFDDVCEQCFTCQTCDQDSTSCLCYQGSHV